MDEETRRNTERNRRQINRNENTAAQSNNDNDTRPVTCERIAQRRYTVAEPQLSKVSESASSVAKPVRRQKRSHGFEEHESDQNDEIDPARAKVAKRQGSVTASSSTAAEETELNNDQQTQRGVTRSKSGHCPDEVIGSPSTILDFEPSTLRPARRQKRLNDVEERETSNKVEENQRNHGLHELMLNLSCSQEIMSSAAKKRVARVESEEEEDGKRTVIVLIT